MWRSGHELTSTFGNGLPAPRINSADHVRLISAQNLWSHKRNRTVYSLPSLLIVILSAGASGSTRYLTGTGGCPCLHANTPRMLLFSRNATAQLHATVELLKHGLWRTWTCIQRQSLSVLKSKYVRYCIMMYSYTLIHGKQQSWRKNPPYPRPGASQVCSGASCDIMLCINFFQFFNVFKIFVTIFVHNEI